MALALGVIGGTLFFLIGFPLPWMLGALTFTTVAALCGVRLNVPRPVRNTMIPALGVGLGSFFDPEVLQNPFLVITLALLVLVYMSIITGLGYLFFRRLAGYDAPTSCFSAIPGGLSEVLLLAEPLRADLRVISLIHAARLAVAIPAITLGLRYTLGIDDLPLPPDASARLGMTDAGVLLGCAVVGFLLARRLRLPAPHMFGPLLLSATAFSVGLADGAVPPAVIAVAQIMIGTFIGARFSGVDFKSAALILIWSVAWSLTLLSIVAGFALGISLLLDISPSSAFLAFSPGGVAEISMLTLSAGASVALVMTVQFLRISTTFLIGPLLARWLRSTKRY